VSPAEKRTLIALLGFLTFNAVYSGIVTAPVLTQIADEYDITTGTAAWWSRHTALPASL